MDAWGAYEARYNVSHNYIGSLKREVTLNRTQDRYARKLINSLPYEIVKIDGVEKAIAVKDTSDDLAIKKIYSMPGESLPHGSLLEWKDSMWLITEVDAHDTLYTKGKMRRCNYYLKWIDDTGNVVAKWCVVEDGTKYLIGEKSNDLMTIGDARMAVTIGKDSDTNKLSRGRRFLIDDLDTEDVLAYQITKSNKLYNIYNGKGVFRFILNEVNLTDNDNIEERIADYYNWRPKTEIAQPDTKVDDTLEEIVAKAKEKEESAPETIKESGVWL